MMSGLPTFVNGPRSVRELVVGAFERADPSSACFVMELMESDFRMMKRGERFAP